MKIEFSKKLRIASELLAYCHSKGAIEFNADIKDESSEFIIKVKAHPVHLSAEALEKLRARLDAPRRRDIEQNYWGLMGESESFNELMLVGMMSDETEVFYEEDVLTITIRRFN
ncbi:MAG: hypothetical protein FWH24_03795 [Oscillospiraceae bacterium]|nr:hypothetical protein [Oscillospiraceae bacterium]